MRLWRSRKIMQEVRKSRKNESISIDFPKPLPGEKGGDLPFDMTVNEKVRHDEVLRVRWLLDVAPDLYRIYPTNEDGRQQVCFGGGL